MFENISILFVLLALHNFARASTIGIHHPHHKSDGRIINGYGVRAHSVPYMVALTSKHVSEGWIEYCGGSLISDRHILTAAHCLNDGRKVDRLQFAAHNRFANENFQVVRTDATFVIHEDNDKDNYAHDIALIKLKDPVDIENNPYIKTVKLPEQSATDETYEGKAVQAYGCSWINEFSRTRPNKLMGIDLTIMSHQTCESEYTAAYPRGHLYDYEICTGSHDTSKPVGTCHGDSGGPLIYNNTLIGVTSRGPTWYCSLNEPSVYISVGKHLDWIKDKMKTM